MDVQEKSDKPAARSSGIFDSSMVPFWTYMAGGIGIVAGLLGLLLVFKLG